MQIELTKEERDLILQALDRRWREMDWQRSGFKAGSQAEQDTLNHQWQIEQLQRKLR